MIQYKEGDYCYSNKSFSGNIRYYHLVNKFGLTHPSYPPGEGPLHREDDPAIEYLNGNRIGFWYIKGKEISVNNQQEFERYLKLMIFI